MSTTSRDGTAGALARVPIATTKQTTALHTLDILLSKATTTASTKTPTQQTQPLPPSRRDTLAHPPLAPGLQPDNSLRQRLLGYDQDKVSEHERDSRRENHIQYGCDDSDVESPDLHALASSKDFTTLLHNHVQQQQLLRRQRLQIQQHRRQQRKQQQQQQHEQRERACTEHSQGLDQHKSAQQDYQGNQDAQKREQENTGQPLETDSGTRNMPIRAEGLPNPFQESAKELTSPSPTRTRRTNKAKAKNNTATLTSTTIPATIEGSSVPPSSSDAPISGLIPKRQYKKTILRQQAALLAAQIKDENDKRDMEATRRVLDRTSVLKHLRSLRSRLTYAQYKVEQGLEEQPLHIVTELFEENLEESDASDNGYFNIASHRSVSRIASVPKRRAPVGGTATSVTTAARSSRPECVTPRTERTAVTSGHNGRASSTALRASDSKLQGTEQNLDSDESEDLHQEPTIRVYNTPTSWKTPTKQQQGRLVHDLSEYESESDEVDSELELPMPTRSQRPRSVSERAESNENLTAMSITQEGLRLQQRIQLEELQQKQLEQLQELQKMQQEQQLALQNAHAQMSARKRSDIVDKVFSRALKSQANGRSAKIYLAIDKENENPSPSVTRLEKLRRQGNFASPSRAPQRKHTSPSPAFETHRSSKSSTRPETLQTSSNTKPSRPSSRPSSPFSRPLSAIDAFNSASPSAASNESHQRPPLIQRRSVELRQGTDNKGSKAGQASQHVQQQEEYRHHQEQKLLQNRQKEQELLRRQRQLEQQQAQQQKRKQLLLQLQQHQLYEQEKQEPPAPANRQQRPLSLASTRLTLADESSRTSPFTSNGSILSTPKKKKPLNPVQKAPSTENILASVRSTPTGMRSVLTAASPALSMAKNALLGIKRVHAVSEDKENMASPQSPPLRGKPQIAPERSSPPLDQSSFSKAYKRQKPVSLVSKTVGPQLPRLTREIPVTCPKVGPVSIAATAVATTTEATIQPPLPNLAHSASAEFAEALVSSPLAPLLTADISDGTGSMQNSKEFLSCFDQWMSDLGNEDTDSFAFNSGSQPTFDFASAVPFGNLELEEEQGTEQSGAEDNLHDTGPGDQSEQEDETELDESEIDQLLYSEVGEDYGAYGGHGGVSTPGSELGPQDLVSDAATAELYDWFPTTVPAPSSYSATEHHLSLLSSDPTLSSSPAELAQGLELELEFDPAGDPLWIQQELRLQQQEQQQQHDYHGHSLPHMLQRDGSQAQDLGSSIQGTPQLDSTSSTLPSSSFSEILLPTAIMSHSNHYIPMGPGGQAMVFSPVLAKGDFTESELNLLDKHDPRYSNISCVFSD